MALKENLEQIRTDVNNIKGTLYNKYITDENTKLGGINEKLDRVPIIYTPQVKTYLNKRYYTFNPDKKDWIEPEWNTRNSVIKDLYLDLEDGLDIDGYKAFMGYFQEGTIAYNLQYINSSTGKLRIMNGERMFINCKKLKKIPLIEFNSNVANLNGNTEYMFSACENLEYIYLSGKLGTSFYPYSMFNNCKNLKAIYGLDATNFKSIPNNFFNGCINLKFVDFSQTENYDNLSSIDFRQCTSMIGENLFVTLMTLPQNTKTDSLVTIYLSATQSQSLTNLNTISPYYSNNNIKMYFKQTSSSTYNELNILYLIMILKGFNFSE